MRACEFLHETNWIAHGLYDPSKDILGRRDFDDTRKPEITLKMLNTLKKIRVHYTRASVNPSRKGRIKNHHFLKQLGWGSWTIFELFGLKSQDRSYWNSRRIQMVIRRRYEPHFKFNY